MNYISNQYYLLVLFGELSLQQVGDDPAAFPQPPSPTAAFWGPRLGPSLSPAFALPGSAVASALHPPPVPPGVSLPAPPTGRPIWALCCLSLSVLLRCPGPPAPSLEQQDDLLFPLSSHFPLACVRVGSGSVAIQRGRALLSGLYWSMGLSAL